MTFYFTFLIFYVPSYTYHSARSHRIRKITTTVTPNEFTKIYKFDVINGFKYKWKDLFTGSWFNGDDFAAFSRRS